MKYLFSPRKKHKFSSTLTPPASDSHQKGNRFSTWRKLWVWLAEAEMELGLPEISHEAIDQMKEHQIIQDDEFAVRSFFRVWL